MTTLPPYLTTSPPPITPPTTIRLQALYASTSSQRQSNPTGYSANVSWWSTLIEELLRAGYLGEDHLVFKVDEGLLGKLEWNGGRPRGMGGFVVCHVSSLSTFWTRMGADILGTIIESTSYVISITDFFRCYYTDSRITISHIEICWQTIMVGSRTTESIWK